MKYGRRNIKNGDHFNKYFPTAENDNIKYGNNQVVYNVENIIPEVVKKYKWQTEKIATHLYNKDIYKFCKNIWQFLFNHIQYEYDDFGKEQFRTPARSWADRKSGIDCDCFSIFISCILSNKNIPHHIRITKYEYNPNWQHIYVIVPNPAKIFSPGDNSTYYTIDAVIHEFNKEKQYTQHKTYSMEGNLGIVTEVLSGIEDQNGDIINDILTEGFEGLGTAQGTAKLKNHIIQTRDWIARNPTLYRSQGGDPVSGLSMYDYALESLDKPASIRDKAFELLAKNEARYNKEILNIDDEDLDGFIDDDEYGFSALGDLGKAKARKAKRKEKKAARKEKRQEKKAERKEIRKEKKAIKKETKKEKKAERKEKKAERKQERKEAQGFFRKVGVAVKQGAKQVLVKYNPAVIAARAGFLTAVRLNLFRLASRLAPAYGTEAEAQKAGVNYQATKKMLEKVEDIFSKKLEGSKAELKKAVLIGKLKKGQDLQGIAEMFAGLGDPVTMASVLSAVTILVSVINAITDVEEEHGIEGLGYIEDDVDDTIELLEGLDGFINEESLSGKKVDAKGITAFIKKLFSGNKEKRAARKEARKTKKQEKKAAKTAKKTVNKTNAVAKKASITPTKKNTGIGNKIATGARNFVQNLTKVQNNEIPDDENELIINDTYEYNSTRKKSSKNDNNGEKKKANKIIFGAVGAGILGIGGLALYRYLKRKKSGNSYSSQNNALRGLSKRRKPTAIKRKRIIKVNL